MFASLKLSFLFTCVFFMLFMLRAFCAFYAKQATFFSLMFYARLRLILFLFAEEKPRERISKLCKNRLVETFTDILYRQAEDIKGIITLLEIIMTVNPSTVACERGFFCLNCKKPFLRSALTAGI